MLLTASGPPMARYPIRLTPMLKTQEQKLMQTLSVLTGLLLVLVPSTSV